MTKKQEFSLEYLVRPAQTQSETPSPALFLIHGYGSNKEDLFSFANYLPKEYVIFSLQAPYPVADYGYAWYALDFSSGRWSDLQQAVQSRNQILEFIDQACEVFSLNRQKISLLGFSQGCILSLAIGLSYPQKIHSIVGLSGYLEEQIIQDLGSHLNASQPKIYLSHGVSDQVIPLTMAETSYQKLDALGISYTYETYPVGHSVSQQNFYSFNRWLEENK